MNRVIRFRLIGQNNEIVGYEKWYEGAFDNESLTYQARPCWLYSKDGEYWNPSFIEHRYKNQLTGLQAKGEKEVYEKDILSCDDSNYLDHIDSNWNDCPCKKVIIVYHEGEASFMGKCLKCELHQTLYQPGIAAYCSIIGNAFENPNLLESKE